MPLPGKRWRHVIINTLNTWLHGDPRGFRHRSHDIHSNGDYKHPPPPREHAGLYRYMRSRCGDEVRFPKHLRPIVGRAIRDYLETHGHRVLAVAVGRVHAHVVTELPDDIRTIKQILGEAKRKSSRAVKKELPGKVWSAGAEKKPVDTKAHLGRAVDYVLYEQGEGAWTWSFRDRDEEGKFGRRKPKPKLGPALRSGPP